jgi:trk system potassium uptake protein TrkA
LQKAVGFVFLVSFTMKILIVGAGDVGFTLAQRLSRDGHDITILDQDTEKCRRAEENLDVMVVLGDGDSFKMLVKAGVRGAEVVAAVTDNDLVNTFACRLAKSVGVAITIARVRSPDISAPGYPFTPKDLGIDHLINPEQEAANAIMRLIQEGSATYVVDLEEGKMEIIGLILEEDSPLIDRPLANLTKDYNLPPLQLIAVTRKHTTIIPKGKDVLHPGDHIFAVVAPEYVAEFFKLAGKRKRPKFRNVMIMGGSIIGTYLAQSLAGNAEVKLIESNRVRAEKLADSLPLALVIHGDGTDIELLQAEGLAEMDVFVAVSGDDENNMIATLLAHRLNVRRPIALVNRVTYMPILPAIGINTVISKQMLTVNAILKFIQHRQVAAIATVPGVAGQLIEYIAGHKAKITGKPLRQLHFPHTALVGAVLRDGQMIVPYGDMVIREGDKVVVFALHDAVDELDRLFAQH